MHTVTRLLGGRKAGLGDRRRHNERLLELLRPSRWVELQTKVLAKVTRVFYVITNTNPRVDVRWKS